MNILKKLGFNEMNPNTTYSMEQYFLHIQYLGQEPFKEGILSGAVNTAKNVTRDTMQVASRAAKQIIPLIKKILAAFMDMLKSMILSVENQEKRLYDCLSQFKRLSNELENLDTTNIDTNVTMNLYTVDDLNKAGWNLNATNLNPSGEDNRIATVANFVNQLIKQRNQEDPESLLLKVRDKNTLYESLEDMFQAAQDIFKNDDDYKYFSRWNKVTVKLSGLTKPIFGRYAYTKLKSDMYGPYVAQAFSPAGAFISTDKNESFSKMTKRHKDARDNVTPQLSKEVPIEKGLEELKQSLKFLGILFQYLVNLKVIDALKLKVRNANRMRANIDKFLNMTEKDVSTMKNKEMNNDNLKAKNESLSRESLDLMEAIQAFKEDNTDDITPELTTDNVHSKDNLNKNLNDSTAKINQTFNKNENKQRNAQTKDKFDLKMTDVNTELQTWGLEYLRSYLLASSNVTFQEGFFFNKMTKIMANVGYETIELTKSLIKQYGKNTRPSEPNFGDDSANPVKETTGLNNVDNNKDKDKKHVDDKE